MMIFAAALACGLFVFMLVYFFVMTRLIPKTQVQQRLRDIRYGSKAKREMADAGSIEEIPFVERTIVPLFQGITNTLMKFAPAGIRAMIEQKIMMAGKLGEWSVNAFACGWLFSVALCFLLAFMYVSEGTFPFVQRTAILMVSLAIGAFLPFAILNSMIQKRKKLTDIENAPMVARGKDAGRAS